MGKMPSTACWVSGIPDATQQRVLLFGSVRCTDTNRLDSLDSSTSFERSQLNFRPNFRPKPLDQSFKHGRAQIYGQQLYDEQLHEQQLDEQQLCGQQLYRQQLYEQEHEQLIGLKVSDQMLSAKSNCSKNNCSSSKQSNQRKNHQESYLDGLNNYFISLGGGTSSQTLDGRRFVRSSAQFGEGLYDETI